MGKPGDKKRSKHHDKDKYYNLAREQGYRSRAAYKLLQIDRKFKFLGASDAVLDLCSAPGGWCQVAAKAARPGGSGGRGTSTERLVLGVDLLPMRKIRAVTGLVGDITTEQCRVEIRQTLARRLAGAGEGDKRERKVDVVLCDGAPDIGADYSRDAYVQNEIVLLALRCATAHLRRGGTFVTKVYRSRDYNALLYVMGKLFDKVSPVKPPASRQASAEIFWVCEDYRCPDSIDPRLLDPRDVFDQDDLAAAEKRTTVDVFHKQYGKQKRPSRHGYDLDADGLDATMRKVGTAAEFVTSDDPVGMMTRCTAFNFGDDEEGFKQLEATTDEIVECCADLRVLNRGDFSGLMKWRDAMKLHIKKTAEAAAIDANADADVAMEDAGDRPRAEGDGADDDSSVSSDEERIQGEIEKARARRLREKKRKVKKEREKAAKLRQRRAYGMDLMAVEAPDHHDDVDGRIFSLAAIKSAADLDKVIASADADAFEESDDEDDDDESDGEEQDGADGRPVPRDRDQKLEMELEEAYGRYLQGTKNAGAKTGTRSAKRARKKKDEVLRNDAAEDEDILKMVGDSAVGGLSTDALQYAKMLNVGSKGTSGGTREEDNSGDEGPESDDPGSDEDGVTIEMSGLAGQPVAKKAEDGGVVKGLIHEMAEPTSAKTERWFSNPLFDSISGGDSSKKGKSKGAAADVPDIDLSSDDDDDDDDEGDDTPTKKRKIEGGRGRRPGTMTEAEKIIADMPLTDKERRHQKRVKVIERNERKKARKAAETADGFEVVAKGEEGSTENTDAAKSGDPGFDQMDPAKRARIAAARDLIRAGMGAVSGGTAPEPTGFTTAPAERSVLPVRDGRTYASDEEDYDSDDHARALALGTMMLRKSRANALVDASYNRFAWNDPGDLPDWFVDDEGKNYRPQLPLPPALVAKMKERFTALATKPIAKVAEARARKKKRANTALTAAKKKAESVANSSDMTEAQKLKAVSRAMRGQDAKRPGKTYVVSKKNGSTKGSKGVKLVDKREKSDKRGMDRATKGKTKKRRRPGGGKKR